MLLLVLIVSKASKQNTRWIVKKNCSIIFFHDLYAHLVNFEDDEYHTATSKSLKEETKEGSTNKS